MPFYSPTHLASDWCWTLIAQIDLRLSNRLVNINHLNLPRRNFSSVYRSRQKFLVRVWKKTVLLFVPPGRHWIWGKGGERGGQWGCTKNGFGATPYFLAIADDQEGWEAFSEDFSSISSFLIRLLVICEAEKQICTKQEIRSFLVYFSFLDSALKSMSFHIIQIIISLRQWEKHSVQ